MKKPGKQFLSMLFAAAMILSSTGTVSAENPEQGIPENTGEQTGIELETEELDPSVLHVRKLGEVSEEEEPGEISLKPDLSLEQTVRVSIFLDKKSAVDAGYSTKGIGTNKAAASYRDTLKQQQRSVTASIEKTLGHTLDVKWNLTLLTNAVSANVKVKEIPLIKKIAGVRSVEREMQYNPAETEADPQTANTSQFMTGASDAWLSGYTGAGSRIAIIDTGIDIDHQSFDEDAFDYSIAQLDHAPELMKESEIKNLSSQLNVSGKYISSKIPFAYNYVDNNTTNLGHGTDGRGNHGSHVAGIAAANKYIKSGTSYQQASQSPTYAVGMAPDAQLLLMKVFGSNGGAYDSDYFAAIEDAVVLGCDAANLSLGSGSPGFTYTGSTYQEILNNLTKENSEIVVAISAGNSSSITDQLTTDLYIDDVSMHTGGSPGTFINSLGVASADNTGNTGYPMVFNGKNIFYNDAETKNAGNMVSVKGTWDLVYIDALGTPEDYSAVNKAVSLSGKIVIVNRGDITFVEKGNNAISYKPKALIIANNQPGTIGMSVDDYTGTFPMASIVLSDAEYIKENSVSASTGSITYYTGKITVSDAITASNNVDRKDAEISTFSSWGVPGSLLMKPEISAPGGNIYSVAGYSNASDENVKDHVSYVSYSGTSMAAPHIAGLTAVVAQYVREKNLSISGFTTRALIQSLLMSTATPMINDGEYVSILQQGAGLVDVNKAVSASSVIMTGTDADDATLTKLTGSAADGKVKAEFGDDPQRTGVYEYSFTVFNISDRTLSFSLDTDLFTQARYTYEGETFMDPATTKLNADVTYQWADAEISHDVDQDGDTDSDDAQAILDYLTGSKAASEIDLEAAEMDGEEGISSYDAYLLIQAAGGTEGTVAAHSSRQVKVRISLTDEQKAILNTEYPSGAYIEGFTKVTCNDSTQEGMDLSHEHSIPLLGFYGSWTDPSMFDNMSYTDTLYGAERVPYSGISDTNYLMMNASGKSVKFSGNPYIAEEHFPAERLAVNSNTEFTSIYYNLLRSAGTTGFAVAKTDGIGGNVTDIKTASISASEVTGLYYYESDSSWKNTSTKNISIKQKVSDYVLSEDDTFRIGFYAIPEYNAMKINSDLTLSGSGTLDTAGLNKLIRSNVLGKGAFIGYDFTVDDTDPVITSAVLDGNTITVSAEDNQNIAYLAVMSLDGSAIYAENAPKSSEAEISFDVYKAVTDADGYVAVYAGDYAGNESAVAIKVNDNAQSGKTVYVLTSVLEAGSDYLIVSSGSKGTANALNHSGTTAGKFTVTVKAGTSETNGQPYIESENISSTGVWTAGTGTNETFTFVNSNQYLSNSNNTLVISNSPGNWNWDGTNNRLSINNRYLRYSNNSFSLYNSARSVYLYRKTVLNGSDPYSISSVTITSNTVELYKGSTSSLNADITPLTASDRSVTWTSSNPQIASVDANGFVTAVSAGTATIRATSNGDPSKYAECSVTVVSVNKALNGIVWDENGDIYFSSFNTNSLPAWNKLHTSAVDQELQNAFMADTSKLYASTCDASENTSVIYKVNRSSYDLTEFGTNYVPAFGMARASSRYTDYFVYGYATFIIMGNLTPESDEETEGTYSGLPYGVLDLTETSVGDSYVCGICAKKIGTTSSDFYFLDETGKIWQTTLSISTSFNSTKISFGTPSLVIDTGIGTSFLYQSLYYDGTNIYWSHCDGETEDMIIIDPTSKKIYHGGNFGEGVWPVSGLYVNGSAAPASAGSEPEETGDETLHDLSIIAARDQLMTDAVRARFAAEAEKMSKKKSASSENTGSLHKVSVMHTSRRNRGVNAEVQYVEDDSDTASITFTEGTDETNGVAEISYDPAKVSYVETVKAEDVILSVNPHFEKEDGSSVVRIAYALKKAPKVGDLICTVKFLPCENSEITVTPFERGRDLSIKDERITFSVAGIGHSWADPVWNWNGKEASAVFTCSTDENHVQTIEAAVTETEGTGEDAGYTICTAAAEFNGKQYTDTKKISSIPVFSSHTLVLSGEIGVTFYMDLSMLSEQERQASRMEFTVNGKTAVAAYDPAFTNPSSHEYYGFTCYVNSLQMAEKIHAVFSYGENNSRKAEDVYSVKDYILSMHEKKESYSAEAVALAEAIADYGHYAQIFLKDVNHLGDKYAEMDTVYAQKYDISDVISSVDEYSLQLSDPASVIGKVQMRLSLDSETAISVRLTPKNNEELTATASLNGKSFNAEKQNDGTYIIRITGIKASQLGDEININGKEGQFTVTVSALAYVRSIMNSETYKDNEKAQNAMAALYYFYTNTKIYQESLKKQ